MHKSEKSETDSLKLNKHNIIDLNHTLSPCHNFVEAQIKNKTEKLIKSTTQKGKKYHETMKTIDRKWHLN